ncbi:MAG: dihydrodipicolinate synthase family protein [Nitrososphaerota archaeon]|nr:dihydrodipicolinate synthase family protein [Nitrososphaerota archaeon]
MPAGEIRGLFTALITPFDSQGRVDTDRLSKLVRFQVSKGVEGIYPCGSTGLGPLLSLEERRTVADTVVAEAHGKVPVVVQVGCADTASTIELATHAEKAGADAIASLTPYYYRPGDRAVARHFEAVRKSVSVPLFAYNIPQFTGNNLQAGAVAAMAKDGTIAGIKDSSRDLLHLIDLLEAVPDDFVVMNGTEEYALFAIMSGADGLVSGGASALPEVFKSLVAAQRKGDYGSAVKAQDLVQKVKDLVKAGPIPAYYAILRERGVECGEPRAPFLPLEKETAANAVKGLKALGVI